MLNTGIFPDALKISKVSPLFKKDNDKLFSNYRPISSLPSISKLFEKVILTKCLNTLRIMILYLKTNMDLEKIIQLNSHCST